MDAKVKKKLEAYFSGETSPADCCGALSDLEKNLDEIDFDDDRDMEDMMELILRALKLDDGNVELLEFLISRGLDINYKLVGDDCLILKYMKDAPRLSMAEKLVELGADICSETLDGDSVLSILAERDGELAVCIAEEYDLRRFDRADRFGMTPLMYAAMKGNNKLAALLIRQDFDVNAAGCAPVGKSLGIETDGVTPLALAIRFGNVETVRLLLEAGADETLCDVEGNPPVFSLIRYPVDFFSSHLRNGDDHPIFDRKRRIVSLLEQTDLTDAEGYTVLMRSLFPMSAWYAGHAGIPAHKNLPVTLALIEAGADVDAMGNDGKRPLHQAVVTMDGVVRELVRAGADLNAQDNDGNTPLIYACRYAEEETVIWLLKAGADFKLQNNEGKTAEDIAAQNGYSRALELMESDRAFLQACKNNQKRAVQVILKRGGADMNEQDEAGNTPLSYVCRNNAPDMARLLLEHGADPNLGNQANRMPLHYAAERGNLAVIDLLIKAGADLNCTDSAGVSPLMLMARHGKTVAALKFIQNPGADILLRDHNNRTAVTYAAVSGQQQLVKALLEAGAGDAGADAFGNTTLHYACYNSQTGIVRILLEESRDNINKTNDEGETPLMYGVRQSNLVIAKLLLEAGAEPDCANLKGLMPLHLAAYNGDIFMAQALLEAGADVDARTKDGQSPLIYACISGKGEFAEMLIEAGADVSMVDNEQHSALYYATEAGMPQVVERLLEAGAEK